MSSEDRAHPPDHPGHVLVAEHGQVARQLDRQAAALHLDEVRDALRADAGAGDRHALAAGEDADAYKLVEVLGLGDRLLLHDDAALLGHRGRVHEVHLLLGAALKRAADDRQREHARVVLGDPPEEGRLDALDRAALR